MIDSIRRFDRALEARREAARLEPPVTYAELLRYGFWWGLPALVGPVVIAVGQAFLTGPAGVLTFGGALIAVAVAFLAGGARALDRPGHATAFAAASVALLAVAFVVAGRAVAAGVAGVVVVLFGLGCLVAGVLGAREVRAELAEAAS